MEVGAAAAGHLQTPAKKLLLVAEDGTLVQAPGKPTLRLRSETLDRPEKVGDFLRRNGLSEDPKTIGMLKRVNPTQSFDMEELPRGTRLDLFAPNVKAGGPPPTKPMTFDTSLVAKWAVKDDVVRASQLRTAAYRLPAAAFEDQWALQSHRKLVSEIDGVAKLVEARADSLSASDLAVAKYQIQYASIRAEGVNQSGALGKISGEDIASLRQAVAPAQNMAERLRSGQSPLPTRRVKVNVFKGDTKEDVKGLQVYVLPAGIFNAPANFSDEDIYGYLTSFSFGDETSPALDNIAVFNTRVWVGPKFRFREMAKLVRSKGIDKFLPINDPFASTPSVELVFRSPADVVSP